MIKTRIEVTGTPTSERGGISRQLGRIFGEIDDFNLLFGLTILSLTLISVALVLFSYWVRAGCKIAELTGKRRD